MSENLCERVKVCIEGKCASGCYFGDVCVDIETSLDRDRNACSCRIERFRVCTDQNMPGKGAAGSSRGSATCLALRGTTSGRNACTANCTSSGRLCGTY